MSVKTLKPESPTRFAIQNNFVLFGVVFRTNTAVKTRLEILCELICFILLTCLILKKKRSVIFIHLMELYIRVSSQAIDTMQTIVKIP